MKYVIIEINGQYHVAIGSGTYHHELKNALPRGTLYGAGHVVVCPAMNGAVIVSGRSEGFDMDAKVEDAEIIRQHLFRKS